MPCCSPGCCNAWAFQRRSQAVLEPVDRQQGDGKTQKSKQCEYIFKVEILRAPQITCFQTGYVIKAGGKNNDQDKKTADRILLGKLKVKRARSLGL